MKENRPNIPGLAMFDPTKPPPVIVNKANNPRPTTTSSSTNSQKAGQDDPIKPAVDKDIGLAFKPTFFTDLTITNNQLIT